MNDALRAIEMILKEIADSIIEGKIGRTEKTEAEQRGEGRRGRI